MYALIAKLVFGLVVVGSLMTAGGVVRGKFDSIKINAQAAEITQLKADAVKLAAAAAKKAADIQHAQDTVAQADAVAEARAQAYVAAKQSISAVEIVRHVQDTAHCITYGFIRVLNHAAIGADGDSATISASAGKPDDACAPVTWRQAAADITEDLHTSEANAEQLNALELDVIHQHQAGAAASGTSVQPIATSPPPSS